MIARTLSRTLSRVKGIPASIAWGSGLIAVGLVLIGISMLSHYSLFATALTWVMFFSAGIGGWLLGRGTKR